MTFRLAGIRWLAAFVLVAGCGDDETPGPDVSTDTSGDTSEDTAEADTTAVDTEPPPRAVGDLCGDAPPLFDGGELSARLELTGSFTDALDDYAVDAGICAGIPAGFGAGGRDVAWRFVAPTAGEYRFSFATEALNVGMYIVSDCDAVAAPCRGVVGQDVETAVSLLEGQEVFVVLDGASGGASYTLAVDPARDPSEAAGNTCTNPRVLGASLPDEQLGDLSRTSLSSVHDASLCGGSLATGGQSADEVWSLEATQVGDYTITVTADAGDVALAVYDTPACDGGCVALTDETQSGAESFVLAVTTVPTTFYIVVDATDASPVTDYTISVAQSCTADCSAGCGTTDPVCGTACGCADGEACGPQGVCVAADAVATNTCAVAGDLVAGLGGVFTANGNNAASTPLSNHFDGALCDTLLAENGPDQVWKFVAPAAGAWEASVDPLTNAELSLTATLDPSCEVGCLGLADNDSAGGETETLELGTLAAGQTVWLIVDTLTPTGGGPYTVRVRELCEASCTEGACGMSDGCGGVCGCAAGETCTPAGTCAVPVGGDDCGTATALAEDVAGSGVWVGSVDLSAPGLSDSHSRGGCAKLGDLETTGVGLVDAAVSFVVPAAGDWRVDVAPDAPTNVMVTAHTSIQCVDTACLGYVDNSSYGATETIFLPNLSAGATVWLVVDGMVAAGAVGGSVAVTAELDCISDCVVGTCGNTDQCGNVCGCGDGQACLGGVCITQSGDTCDDPRTLSDGGTGVFVGNGDLSAAAGVTAQQDAGACGATSVEDGALSRDEVWLFTAPAPGIWAVELTGTTTDAQLYAFDESTCTNCVGWSNANLGVDGAGERLVVTAESAGDAFRLVVDGVGPDAGQYTLTVSACTPSCAAGSCGTDGCGGQCLCEAGEACEPTTLSCAEITGDTCAGPIALPVAVVTNGDLSAVELSDAFSGGSCPTPVATGTGSDQVFRFEAALDGEYTFAAVPQAGGDVALMIFDHDASAATCSSSCLAGIDGAGPGGDEELTVTLAAGDVRWIVVDDTTGTGAFELTATTAIARCASDLFLSQYVEGSSNNRALEIYNGTGATVALSDYAIWRITNGGTFAGDNQVTPLTGFLAHEDTLVLCNGAANPAIQAVCDQSFGGNTPTNFTGDDAIGLAHGGVLIDVIGDEGADPGASWPVGTGTTQNHTLTRSAATSEGATMWAGSEGSWLVSPQNDVTGLGEHTYAYYCNLGLAPCTATMGDVGGPGTDPSCPTVDSACGVDITGGIGCVEDGIDKCVESGTTSFRLTTGNVVNLTFQDDVTSANVFFSGRTLPGTAEMTFFDAAGDPIAVLTSNGPCLTTGPQPDVQCITLPVAARSAVIADLAGGDVYLDDLEVNPTQPHPDCN